MFPGGPGHGSGRGYEDHPFLAAAAFGKFPGKGLGKLEPPAELAAAMTFFEADCLIVHIVVPREVFHLGCLLLLPVCADPVCQHCVHMQLYLEVCVHLYFWVFACLFVSIYFSLWACIFMSPSLRLLERLG